MQCQSGTGSAKSKILKLVKIPFAQSEAMENTPVLYDNRPLLVQAFRPGGHNLNADDMYLYIRDLATGQEIARFGQRHSFPSAFVNGNEINVFASEYDTKDWAQSIYRFSSTDLKTWKRELAVPRQGSEHLFNTSVCKDPYGFLMAYESNEPVMFCFRFARSKDLSNWKDVEGLIFTGQHREYSACPVIRYFAPYYYVMYLHQPMSDHNGWITFAARSKDLENWELSPLNPILEAGEGEGINNSDVDLFEYDGNTYLYYATGDQDQWSSLRVAMFNGSMEDFWLSCFPGDQDTITISTRIK